MNVIVASSKAHAAATLRWSHLDPQEFTVLLYGKPVTGSFDHALLARPVGEITADHADWVMDVLRPAVTGSLQPCEGWTDVTPAPLPRASQAPLAMVL